MRRRQALSLGVIAALIVGIWAAWASGDDPPPPTTIIVTDPTTTTTTTVPPTTTLTTAVPPPTTTPPTTSTSTPSDPEARTEEVRQILEDLYFRWFDAIYHNDEEAVREVIATERYLNDFRRSVENLELPSAPLRSQVLIKDLEILHDEPHCLVTYSTLDLSEWRGQEAVVTGVNVLLPVETTWRFGTAWSNRNDLWKADCQIEPEL